MCDDVVGGERRRARTPAAHRAATRSSSARVVGESCSHRPRARSIRSRPVASHSSTMSATHGGSAREDPTPRCDGRRARSPARDVPPDSPAPTSTRPGSRSLRPDADVRDRCARSAAICGRGIAALSQTSTERRRLDAQSTPDRRPDSFRTDASSPSAQSRTSHAPGASAVRAMRPTQRESVEVLQPGRRRPRRGDSSHGWRRPARRFSLRAMSERTRNLPRRSCLSVPGSSEKMLGKAPGPRRRHGVPRPRGLRRAAGEGGGARQGRQRDQRARTGATPSCACASTRGTRSGPYRDVIDGRRERRRAPRRDHAARRCSTAAEVQALDLLLTQIEETTGRASRTSASRRRSRPRGASSTSRRSARRSPRLETIIFGPADFAASTEMPVLTGGVQIPEYPGDHFHYVFSKILMAGRANGLQVIDGPFLKIRELDALRDYAMRTRILGYDGKWALHPDQVTVINEVFTPTQEQFDQRVRHPRGLREGHDRGRPQGRGDVRRRDDRRGQPQDGDQVRHPRRARRHAPLGRINRTRARRGAAVYSAP